MNELPSIKQMISIKKAGLDDFGMTMEKEKEPEYTERDYQYDLQDIKRHDANGKWYHKDCIRWDTMPSAGAPLKDRQKWAQDTLRAIQEASERAKMRAQEYGTRESRSY